MLCNFFFIIKGPEGPNGMAGKNGKRGDTGNDGEIGDRGGQVSLDIDAFQVVLLMIFQILVEYFKYRLKGKII